MIDTSIQDRARSFIDSLRPFLGVSPVLALDYAWPSVAVLDALTFPLRKKASLSKREEELVAGVASYLGLMAYSCWKAFCAEPELVVGPTGVELRAKRGPKLDGTEPAVAYLERDLRAILLQPPRELLVCSSFRKVIAENDNALSAFAFGLFVGLLPTIEGPWARESVSSFAEQIAKVVDILAVGSADAYGRIFPDDALGRAPDLYRDALIYPLTLMAEDLPLRASARSALDYFERAKAPLPSIMRTSFFLSRMPDERISGTGFLLCVALASLAEIPDIRATAQGFGISLGLSRSVLAEIRERRGLGGDWLLKPAYDESDRRQIEKEITLGFFPWLKLPLARVYTSSSDRSLKELLLQLSFLQMDEALALVAKLLSTSPQDAELRVQRAYLLLACGEAENAAEELRTAINFGPSAAAVDMLGTIALIEGDTNEAARRFAEALTLPVAHDMQRAEILNNAGWTELLRGNAERALALLDESTALDPALLVALVNRATALHQLGREEPAKKLDEQLLYLAPLNRDVFRGLVYDPAIG